MTPIPPPTASAPSFVIVTPDLNQCVNPDTNNTILVRVRDKGTGNTSYSAAVTAIGVTAVLPGTSLAQEGTTQFFSARLSAGIVPASSASNNKTVTVRGVNGSHNDTASNDFVGHSGHCMDCVTVPFSRSTYTSTDTSIMFSLRSLKLMHAVFPSAFTTKSTSD